LPSSLCRSMPRIESWLLVNSFGQRLQKVFASRGQLCVGLDPSTEQLHCWELPVSAAGAEQFCTQIIDACHESIGILKPQISFFEQFGSAGFAALERVLVRASAEGFLVIADAKRGDIGSTMDGYARAWLASNSPFLSDALTVSPFLGPQSLNETAECALQNSKGLFVLSATSNAEAMGLQAALISPGQSVARNIASFASGFNQAPLGSIGVVIGARTNLKVMGIDASYLSNTPILAPGFGAQGAKLSEARSLFGELAPSVIFTVSRSVAGKSPNGLKNRVLEAKNELEIGLSLEN
jgi:orotidine-5'-phosphate decarboxylase